MKIYTVEFEGVYPVDNCLVIMAYDLNQAKNIAAETIGHTDEYTVIEEKQDCPKVVVYLSGDY